jgi:lactoylglutathione lyase
MTVQRVVANIAAPDPAKASAFYGDILGLDVLMDMAWIRTYGNETKMSVQVSFMSESGERRCPTSRSKSTMSTML